LIFKPFKRLHTKSEYPGSGLGLATVKKIVEKMNGTISVRSVLGEGTTFILTFPKL
jgi:signal transduction histidine kinase